MDIDAALKPITDLGFGYSVDFRPYGTDWPFAYRLRITATSNSKSDFRFENYGETLEEVVQLALAEFEATQQRLREQYGP